MANCLPVAFRADAVSRAASMALLVAQWYPFHFFGSRFPSLFKISNPPSKATLITIWLLGYQAAYSEVIRPIPASPRDENPKP